jgi:hypothetical protein
MTFLRRLQLYGTGFVLGLILVYFFFGFRACSNVSDVKLYELSMQEIVLSEQTKRTLDSLHIPVHYFRYSFKCGDWKIDFENSKPRETPCKMYVILPTSRAVFHFKMYVEDCDHRLLIKKIIF